LPVDLLGTVTEPGAATTNLCDVAEWSTGNATDTLPAVGCFQTVTFGEVGTRTLTFSATNAWGDKVSQTRTVNVISPPTRGAPVPHIDYPPPGILLGKGEVITLRGSAFDPTGISGPLGYNWSYEYQGVGVNIGQGETVSFSNPLAPIGCGFRDDDLKIVLMVWNKYGEFAIKTVNILARLGWGPC
jgi:hypothetical protein